MNMSYFFALYVNGKVHKVLNWYCEDEKMMKRQAVALCAGAKVFKSTAGVLVYGLGDDKNYHICHSVDFKPSWFIFHEVVPAALVDMKFNLADMLNTATWEPYKKGNVMPSVL